MSINIGPPAVEELRPRITVIGIGGAGGNAIANMIEAEIEGVDFIVANTDAQALNNAAAEHRIQLGPEITQGLGAGSRPEVGRAAAEETVAEIERTLEGVNMVFIAAGMGGGTGTGAAPVIAETARKMGILTVGVVTKPFLFEGTRRMRSAEAGIEELQKHVDTLIVIPNQNLFLVAKKDTTFKEAFQLADEVLQQGVRSITDLMVMPGLINLDFADVRSVMGEMGKAMMGTGEGEGDNRALEAAERAIANPLLDGVSMHGAKGVIISIIGGEDMKLLEVDEAANHIREMVDPEANIIWGSAFNPDLDGKIRVSVVATGIDQSAQAAQQASMPRSNDFAAKRGPKKPALPFADPQALTDDEGEAEEAADTLDALDLSDLKNVAVDEEPEEVAAEEIEELPDLPDETPSEELAEPEVAANDEGDDEPLDLTMEEPVAEPPSDEESGEKQDELLLDASRLAEEDAPVQSHEGRRRRILGGAAEAEETGAETSEAPAVLSDPASRTPSVGSAGGTGAGAAGGGSDGGGGGGGSSSGSTLFERMANLSRNSGSEDGSSDEEDDEDDASAMRIPRFLGRQNNQ